MPKVPPAVTNTAKVLITTYGVNVAKQLIAMLNDPQHADQARGLAAGLAQAARGRTASGRLDAKLATLGAHTAELADTDAVAAGWDARLRALRTKRDLVTQAYRGKERTRRLKEISAQVDDVLEEVLSAQNAIIEPPEGGRS